jgi:hypothetical protein
VRNQNLRKSKLNPEAIKKALEPLTPFERIEFLSALKEVKNLDKPGHKVKILSKEKITQDIQEILNRLLREVPKEGEKRPTS